MFSVSRDFKYTGRDGNQYIAKNLDIIRLFKLRFYEQVPWTNPGASKKYTTIVSELGIDRESLGEAQYSIEYRECAIKFLQDVGYSEINLGNLHTNKTWRYLLVNILGSYYTEPLTPEDLEKHKKRVEKYKKFRMKNSDFAVKMDERVRILLDTDVTSGILSQKTIEKLNQQKLIKKIDQYKEERESNYKGVTREGLIQRLNEMIDSREHWKSKLETEVEYRKHTKNELKKVLVKLDKSREKSESLEVENANIASRNTMLERANKSYSIKVAQLERQLKMEQRNPNKNDSGELDSLISKSPESAIKIIRRKFMVAAHPDKIRDVMSKLSQSEQQAVNRLFDYIQKKLKK